MLKNISVCYIIYITYIKGGMDLLKLQNLSKTYSKGEVWFFRTQWCGQDHNHKDDSGFT